MKNYITKDPWKIVEDQFHPEHNKITESLCSIGNGKMGSRGNFEEEYSGETLQGNYYAGIYYPDKTKVGWWKNGYPEYFAKVLNGCNWSGLKIKVGAQIVDLHLAEITSFHRELDMRKGLIKRDCSIKLKNGAELNIQSERFCSLDNDELACLSYKLAVKNFKGTISIESILDFDISNEDSNYDQKFWEEVAIEDKEDIIFNHAITKKTKFELGVAAAHQLTLDGSLIDSVESNTKEKFISQYYNIDIENESEIHLLKYVGVCSSLYYPSSEIKKACIKHAHHAIGLGYDALVKKHTRSWSEKWNDSDIEIEGDIGAQQGIRFNIFHLNQTYTGQDARLNIGPKGFTGEKYGGSTYWDTEAYCIPFYLSTADEEVSRNLLIYRHNHLRKAIENAEKLGFENGAALYPMVTINGEECHNEWEITFEEIHRNGAIAYAIYNYIKYTGDSSYLQTHGLEVLIGIARFWAQRVNYSEAKQKYVMLGVTGPNEYENNVNNNWYTNFIAVWCLKYCLEAIAVVEKANANQLKSIFNKTEFSRDETINWKTIIKNMHYPESKELGIFLQQDNFLDKDQTIVAKLDPKHLPLNQNWSWDRILRSVYIKQADVLQGIYFFEDQFDLETIRRNFEYYEPRTVHESSLSPCVHVILANLLEMDDKAYEMYLRTSRLDIDDYNNDTEDGLHITSMAGTWMSIVQGFGGMRIKNDKIYFNPRLPKNWDNLSFRIKFRSSLLSIKISQSKIELKNDSNKDIQLQIADQLINLNANESKVHSI